MMKQLFRRISPLVLSLLLIVSLLPQQAHAASAGLDASTSYLRAGNSFTLYLYVSGSEVAGIEASLSYDSSALTYNGYSNYIGGSWVLSESSRNFTMYNSAGGTFSGSPYLISLSFTVKSGASEGADLSVSVSGTASEGGSDSSFYASWSSEVLPPLSGNANLDDLWCDNAELNFTGGTEYSITVPYEVSFLELDWDRAHSGSYVSVSGNSLSVGSNTVTVTVEAENGNTKRYYIYVTREQDPNYVPSSDATLSSLSPSTGTLSPAFAADVTDYVLYVPYETTALSINATANDSKAKGVSQIRQVLLPAPEVPADDTAPADDKNAPDGGAAADPKPAEPLYRTLATDEPLPEGETIYAVTCTAEDGTTTMDYTVHVIRMPLYAGMLPEIIPPVTEPVEPEPEPEPTTYDISLPLVMTLPYIGEVTLQQAALGAAIVLGVLLLLLLLLAWLIGRAGGKRKALRKLAEAQRRPDAPEEALLTRLAAAQTEVGEPAPAEEAQEEPPTEAETPTVTEEAPAPAEEPAAEEVIPEETAKELPAEKAPEELPAAEDAEADTLPEDTAAMPLCESTEEPAEDAEEAAPAEEPEESPEDAAQSAPQEEDSDSTAVSEDAPAEATEEAPQEEADEAVSAMSLEQLLEDIRNM